MPLDINLILRKWAFDLDSEALGRIRIANVNMQKIFEENEIAIRAGEVQGDQLARVLLEKMAHKLTGDEAVDKVCQGPRLERADLDLLTSGELDLFADTLIKNRLRFVIPQGVALPRPTTETGCAALSGALIAFVDADSASRAALAETWKKQVSAADQITAQWKQTQSLAAGLGLTDSIVEAEKARAEKWKSIVGVESVADKAMRDWKRQDDLLQTAMGYGLDGGVAATIAQYERDRKLAVGGMDLIQSSALGFAGMSATERIGMASGHSGSIAEFLRENDLASKLSALGSDAFRERDVTVREISVPVHVFSPPPPPPPNPAHETNKIMGELLDHQKEEAAKKEAESANANATSKSGLIYTKLSFWVTLVAFVIPSICGTWVYFEQKASSEAAKVESAESVKAAATESARQQAEIKELTAALRKSIESKPSGDKAVKPVRTKQ